VTVLQTCPTCGKALDPMHAPVARIRGGKVVSFCSAECASTGAPGENALRRPRREMPALARPGTVEVSESDVVEIERRVEVERAARPTPRPEVPRPEPVERRGEPRVEPRIEIPVQARRARRLPSSRDYLDMEDEERGPRPRPAARGAVLAVCALVLAAGVALLAREVMPLRRAGDSSEAEAVQVAGEGDVAAGRSGVAAARRAPASARPTAAVGSSEAPEAAPAAEAAPQPAAAQREASAELRALMASSSPRVRRMAAQALARTGDEPALTLLRQLLREEPSQLGRIQIAYALARAGDKPAREILRGQLGSERRDVRVDAARSLVQLGDDSGRKTLRSMLSVEQHRIGAAGLLARLGDDDGLSVLRREAADKRATPEARMRAQVALGRAGDGSVKGALHKVLADKRYNVGAADALAALGDEAAAPALTVQLGLSAMRVQAALWLRRMKKEVDLAPLALALQAGDEASRVSAGEALLILAGPESLAERD
jgi:HEAT repeat protein